MLKQCLVHRKSLINTGWNYHRIIAGDELLLQVSARRKCCKSQFMHLYRGTPYRILIKVKKIVYVKGLGQICCSINEYNKWVKWLEFLSSVNLQRYQVRACTHTQFLLLNSISAVAVSVTCFLKLIIQFCFWLSWVFTAAHSLSLVNGDCSCLRCWGFLWWWLLLFQSIGSRCSASVVAAHRLSCSVACGIFLDRYPTCVPCVGRQILIHQGSPSDLLSCGVFLPISS